MAARVVSRMAAGLAAAMAVFALASLAPYAEHLTDLGRPGPSTSLQAMRLVGALIWAAIGLAFLARGGEGPLRAAPRLLVNVLCWYGLISAAVDLFSVQGLPPGAWQVVFVVLSVLVLGFGAATMRMTGPPRSEGPGPPPVPSAGCGADRRDTAPQ